jgi:hypothetical protein
LVPFADFVAAITSTSDADLLSRLASRVRDAAALQEMRLHLLTLYQGVHVAHSQSLDGQVFDCVPVGEQPSVRLLGLSAIAATPPPALPPVGFDLRGAKATVGADPLGQAEACEDGTIPMRRITLDEMSRFETLHQFFMKGPDGAGQAPEDPTIVPAVAATHKYAHMAQTVNNLGGNSSLNLWNQTINTGAGEVFSLAQHWYVGNIKGGGVQTLEGGWQHFPQKYNIDKPVLFIYWTADSYNKTGCYNLECPGFIQVNKTIHLGGAFGSYSVDGGAQREYAQQWYLQHGNWWYFYQGMAVGYYPIKIYKGGEMSKFSDRIDYGGEVVGATIWPPMGSGKFASTGFKHAAYQRFIYYIDTTGVSQWSKLLAYMPSPSCYTSSNPEQYSSNWGSYFYFGGPGGKTC